MILKFAFSQTETKKKVEQNSQKKKLNFKFKLLTLISRAWELKLIEDENVALEIEI